MNFTKRLTILNQQEIDDLYAQPEFSKEERHHFFALNDTERLYLKKLTNPDAKIWFVLQLGYFRAKHLFYDINLSKSYHDIRHIRSAFLNGIDIKNRIPDRISQIRYRDKILEFTGYQSIDKKNKRAMDKFIKESARRSLKPRSIFFELLEFFRERRFALFEYSSFCDLIGALIEKEQKRLCTIIRKNTSKSTDKLFGKFLANDDNDYGFSFIKREVKNLGYSEIGEELLRHEALASVYPIAVHCVSKFELSNQNIKYLASLAAHYKLTSLRSFPKNFSAVILCCYVLFRFQKSTDVLIDAFLGYLSKTKRKAAEYAKDEVYRQRQGMTVEMEKVAGVLDIFTDESIPDSETFAEVKNRAFRLLNPEEIKQFSRFIRRDFATVDSFKWDFYVKRQIAFKKNLRPILKSLEFYSGESNDPIIIAIDYFKRVLQDGEKNWLSDQSPTQFIPRRLMPHIMEGSALDPAKYELVLYFQIARRLDARDLFIRNSTKYLSIMEDLISDKQWHQRDEYLKSSPFQRLAQEPGHLLDALKEQLEAKIASVNANIKSGLNDRIVIKKSNGQEQWTLPYKKQEDLENEGVFDLLQQVNICDVVSYVHQKTGFLNRFEHIQPRFSKSSFSLKNISACLVATGSNIGLNKIAEIADININTLASTYRNYFHVDNIRGGSQKIINDATQLAAYKNFYIRRPNVVHAGADGQKFAVKYRNQMARHSPKYFHTGVGIVAYSLIANHFPINALTIGAHDHESHFLFDLIFNNSTDIDPSIVSSDMHGINHINFSLLYMFGRQFAPRYKNIHKRFSDIRGFNDPDTYGSMFIQPQKKADRKLIESEWDNILKILLSLAMKETSQSIIIQKLSSNAFSDKTKKALWELDSILKSIYLLEFLDDEYLQQDVCHAQNRAESFHKLKRAIANITGGKLLGTRESEIEIWGECSRLLTNCIIYYNTDILSRILEKSGNSEKIVKVMRKISPVSWQHINFLGKYVFRDDGFELDMDQMISEIDWEKIAEAA